jgi:PKD repeat protein
MSDFGSTLVSPLTRQFVDLTPPPLGSPVHYQWTFGDGGGIDSTPSPVTHTFPAPGTYLVTMTRHFNDGITPTDVRAHSVLIPGPVDVVITARSGLSININGQTINT